MLSHLSFPKHAASGGYLPRPSALERIKPGPGQESVWEYPFTRPPTFRAVPGQHAVIKVNLPGGGQVGLVDSKNATQVLEESHPPTWYFPIADVAMHMLKRVGDDYTMCEFKGGQARYFDVVLDGKVLAKQACWTYEGSDNPLLVDRLAFYLKPPALFSATVDGEQVIPQEGDYYGGWILPSKVVGPFKGSPGTRFW